MVAVWAEEPFRPERTAWHAILYRAWPLPPPPPNHTHAAHMAAVCTVPTLACLCLHAAPSHSCAVTHPPGQPRKHPPKRSRFSTLQAATSTKAAQPITLFTHTPPHPHAMHLDLVEAVIPATGLLTKLCVASCTGVLDHAPLRRTGVVNRHHIDQFERAPHSMQHCMAWNHNP